MHELYELTIESADLELAVTEGFADKAKSTASKIIEKLKTFIKKFIVFIKDKCVKFIKYVLHLATKLKNLTEMDDREMIDVPNCIIVDDSAKTLMSIEKKVLRALTQLEKGDDVDEEYLNFSKERSTIDQILLGYSQSISVAKAKKDIMGTLSYIHQKNNIAVGIIKSLNDMIDKLEKDETNSNRLDRYNQLVIIQKLISIEQYMITYNNKTLEKCLILIKKIGNKKIKDEVETSKKIEDHVTKPVLN
jgi:hypothetical protein